MSKYFIDKNPTLDTYWRSIILLGRNVASYKFALGKTLIDLNRTRSEIALEDIALPYAKNICEHLKKNSKQITSASSKFIEYCLKFNNNEISEDNLKEKTIQLGFNNVIDAFHNVAYSEVPLFFEDNRKNNKSIILTDNFFNLMEIEQNHNFNYEIESRWNLWETAISLRINPNLLQIHNDDEDGTLYHVNENRRIDITSSKDTLNGYQKGKCFYCKKNIRIETGHKNSCDVDHFFPHKLLKHGLRGINQIWNLVLSCQDCNRGPSGKFERIPHLDYLDQLHSRNNYLIESVKPLRETIYNQIGRSESERISFLQSFYDEAIMILPIKWVPKEKHEDEL